MQFHLWEYSLPAIRMIEGGELSLLLLLNSYSCPFIRQVFVVYRSFKVLTLFSFLIGTQLHYFPFLSHIWKAKRRPWRLGFVWTLILGRLNTNDIRQRLVPVNPCVWTYIWYASRIVRLITTFSIIVLLCGGFVLLMWFCGRKWVCPSLSKSMNFLSGFGVLVVRMKRFFGSLNTALGTLLIDICIRPCYVNEFHSTFPFGWWMFFKCVGGGVSYFFSLS